MVNAVAVVGAPLLVLGTLFSCLPHLVVTDMVAPEAGGLTPLGSVFVREFGLTMATLGGVFVFVLSDAAVHIQRRALYFLVIFSFGLCVIRMGDFARVLPEAPVFDKSFCLMEGIGMATVGVLLVLLIKTGLIAYSGKDHVQ